MQLRITDVCSKLETLIFNTSNHGATDGFASLFPVYGLFANSQRNKDWEITVTQSANASVLREVQEVKWPRKRKAYIGFIAEQRATIGRYACENGNVATVKKFLLNLSMLDRLKCINKDRIKLMRGQIFQNRINLMRSQI